MIDRDWMSKRRLFHAMARKHLNNCRNVRRAYSDGKIARKDAEFIIGQERVWLFKIRAALRSESISVH